MTTHSENSTTKLGMLIDLSTCIGCNACVTACKLENDTAVDCFNTWVESWDSGTYPDVTRSNLPKQCNHCSDAPCQEVCPTGATYTTEDGVVLVDESRCIGCKYCMVACPFQVRWHDHETGIVDKCTFCYHRSANGLQPKCVNTCITKARIFGNLQDPDSDISKRLAEVHAERLPVNTEDEVSVFYVGLSKALNSPFASSICCGGNVKGDE